MSVLVLHTDRAFLFLCEDVWDLNLLIEQKKKKENHNNPRAYTLLFLY